MTFNLLVRRLHLYFGAFLLPWFVMFGISSFVINHPAWFQAGEGGAAPLWTTLQERPYDRAVPFGVDLRSVGAAIAADLGYSTDHGFGVGRPNPNRINVNLPSFSRPVRISYFVNEHRVLAEQRAFAWAPALSNMHTHDGYYLHAPWQTAWAVVVDILCVLLVFWVASGLYMWWGLPASRAWGWLAIAAGFASFGALMLAL